MGCESEEEVIETSRRSFRGQKVREGVILEISINPLSSKLSQSKNRNLLYQLTASHSRGQGGGGERIGN